ncbi:MAG: hypothetical protein AAB549_01785 [Patescibacteria group bacterium]
MTQRSVSFVCPAYNERESLPELIRELHELGKTLILVTHDHALARVAGRIIRIEDGHII